MRAVNSCVFYAASLKTIPATTIVGCRRYVCGVVDEC